MDFIVPEGNTTPRKPTHPSLLLDFFLNMGANRGMFLFREVMLLWHPEETTHLPYVTLRNNEIPELLPKIVDLSSTP